MQTETHLCRPFDVTVHEKALDGVGLGHDRLLHVLLGIWAFSTFPCKHFMKNISLLKRKVHPKKRKKEKNGQNRRAMFFGLTAYPCCSLQRRRPDRHRRFLSRPRHIPFRLRDGNRIRPLCHSDTVVTMSPWAGDSPSSMIQSSSCLSCTIFEYCCSSTSSYTLATFSTWKM